MTVAAGAVTVTLAVAIAGFTIWQAFDREADVVSAGGTLRVVVTRLWPAEAAIGLSALVAVAATTRRVTAALGARRGGLLAAAATVLCHSRGRASSRGSIPETRAVRPACCGR